jgi:hypothetical protein
LLREEVIDVIYDFLDYACDEDLFGYISLYSGFILSLIGLFLELALIKFITSFLGVGLASNYFCGVLYLLNEGSAI